MLDGYKIRDQALPHFVTATVCRLDRMFLLENLTEIV
jgi:hypothetical protein